MNIQQLEYLIAVDKYKHFGKAAQSCFITQPTLSAMIQKFEEEIDIKIFDRASHPIRTTDAGLQIVEQAKRIMDEVMELKNKAHLLNNVVSGKLNLGIIPTVSSFLLPNEIYDFLAAHPKVELNVKEMTTENVIRSLRSGEIDAGIISTPVSAAQEFFSDFLYNEELLIYSGDETLASKGRETHISPDEIDFKKIWLLEEGNCLRAQAECICKMKECEEHPSNLDFRASSISTLVQMVDRVGGLTILPEMALDQLTDDQQKRVLHFKKPYPKREVSLIYYKPTYKQKLLDELRETICKSLEKKLSYNALPTSDFVRIKPE